MRYLVDTDWIIQRLNGVEPFVSRMTELGPEGLGLSAVSVGELYEGVFGSADPERRERELLDLLEELEVLDVDRAVAQTFARERRRLRSQGQLIGDLDLLIGATALHHDLTLLTNNRRHFARLDGLRIESLQA